MLAPIGGVLTLLAVLLLCWLPVVLVLLWLKGWSWGQPLIRNFQEKLWGVLSLYLLIPPVLTGYALWVASPPLPLYGLSLTNWQAWGIGLGAGLTGLILFFGCQIGLGWGQWQRVPVPLSTVGSAFGIGLGVAGIEEVLFRGFMLQTLAPYGPWSALLLTSVVFALLHLIWEPLQWSALSTLPGLFGMGLVLGHATDLQSGVVNLAWGLHTAWVWGITVVDTCVLIHYPGTVPPWVTGLDRKPLAGVMGLGLLAMTALVLPWLA